LGGRGRAKSSYGKALKKYHFGFTVCQITRPRANRKKRERGELPKGK